MVNSRQNSHYGLLTLDLLILLKIVLIASARILFRLTSNLLQLGKLNIDSLLIKIA